MRRLGGLLMLAAALSCARAETAPAGATPAPRPGQSVPATVLTVRESSHPPTRAFLHKVVVAGSKVRLGDEKDQWRLFDLDQRTVTWVDDVAKTYRTLSFDELLRARDRVLRQTIPAPRVGQVAVRDTGEIADIGGIRARRIAMELGGYRRDVWVSETPLVPPRFLQMMIASEPISEPWAGVMRDAQRALMAQNGFPVWDRSRLAWEKGELLFQRKLVKVESKNVPSEWVSIPAGYLDTDAPPAPPTGKSR
ncbi:MAG TPA: hypothetical protein VLV48_07215 [Thermoanaerobaculia bacterium]|nr:hypothetical protein [Thermoanaerobaculia bacterium]